MKSNQLKVCIFEPYPFGTMDGNMKTLDYILRYSDGERIKYRILTTKENEFKKRIKSMGIDCDVISPRGLVASHGGKILGSSILNRVKTIIHIIKYNFIVFRYFKENDIEVLYCNSVRSILTVGLASRLSGIRILLYVKGELANPFLDFVSFILANKIIFFSKTNSEDKYPILQKIYRDKIEILEIGLDLDEIDSVLSQDKSDLARELELSKKNVNVGFCGRISRPKGLDVLIKAISNTKDNNIMLYVIGEAIIKEDQIYKESITNLINDLDIQDRVIFLGWRNNHLPIVSMMDIMINPSFSEGFGRNILESMALGKAIIATKTGGLRDVIIDGENGFLVPIKDELELQKKLTILVKDNDLRETLSFNARETIQGKFNIEDKIQRLNNFFYEM